jgi:hypothetical protein
VGVLDGVGVAVAVGVAVMVGVLVGVGAVSANATASSTLMRGKARLFRVSVIDVPVLDNHCNICAIDAVGAACFMSAQAPATCGAAIEVPALYAYDVVLVLVAELMKKPGASTSSNRSPLPLALLLAIVGAFEK